MNSPKMRVAKKGTQELHTGEPKRGAPSGCCPGVRTHSLTYMQCIAFNVDPLAPEIDARKPLGRACFLVARGPQPDGRHKEMWIAELSIFTRDQNRI
jgi:hypothetical protein